MRSDNHSRTSLKWDALLLRTDELFCSPHDVPSPLQKDLLGGHTYDHFTPVRLGKEWLFEFTARFQPRTGRALLAAKGPCIAYRKHDDTYLTNLVLNVGGYVVDVGRGFWGSNPDDPGYEERMLKINASLTRRQGRSTKAEQRHLSLPEPIRMAYYHRFDGLNVPLDSGFSISTRLLPFPVGRPWQSIDNYLNDLRLSKLIPFVEEAIPGIRPSRKDMPFINFMMFLDSRPTLSGREGDVFFVKNHVQDGTIYYIRDADVANMMTLADSSEAIDRYCEHVLLRREGRFDFRPFAVPFA